MKLGHKAPIINLQLPFINFDEQIEADQRQFDGNQILLFMRCLLFCLLLLPTVAVFSQLPQYHGQVFGEEHGISGGAILDVFTDHDQFLWVLMGYSLARFDGRNTRKFTFEEGLTHAICDNNNRIWALAGQQVWRSRADWRGFEQVPFDTSGNIRLRGVFQMDNGPVSLLVSNGLYTFKQEQDIFVHDERDIPVPGSRYSLTRIDTCSGTLFYAGKNVVVALEPVTGRSRVLPLKGEFSHLQALTSDLVVCVGYAGESSWFDFAKGTVTRIDAKKYGISSTYTDMYIRGVTAIGGKQYLVNSFLGFFLYDLGKDRFFKTQIYTEGKPVENGNAYSRINMDRYGRAWTFSYSHILVFKPHQQGLGLLRNYHNAPPRQWDNRTIGLTEDDNGNIWSGGATGFKKLNPLKNEVTAYLPVPGATDRLSNPDVRTVMWDGTHIVLGATDGGVWLFDPKTEQYRRPRFSQDSVRQKLENEVIDYIGRLKNGDMIVCGRFYVFVIKAKTYETEIIHFQGDKSNMNIVFQDSRQRIWLGAETGLYCLDDHYRLLFRVPTPYNEGVLSIFEINEKVMLTGSRKGLRKVIPATGNDTAQYNTVVSFPKGVGVTSIDRDSLNRYWISSLDGLYLGDADLSNFQRFDYADNIQSNIFNRASSFRAKNGLLYLGGPNGLNYFFPEKTAKDEPPLSVRLQSVAINDGDSILYQPKGPVRLAPGRNTLMFEVMTPYYNNAAKVHYRYRLLRGTSAAWIDIGTQNFFRLTDLPAGEYRLEVSAGINGRDWYYGPDAFVFEIPQHFWETWWFLGLLLCCFSGGVIQLVRYRETRLKKHRQTMLELVDNQRKAAEAKLQSMRLQMNPHFLFNALNSIQQMIIMGNEQSATLYLSKFSKLLRMVLSHSDKDEASLREELEMIELYVALEALRFDASFQYEITCDPEIDRNDCHLPTLIIQPFVENAIWHGLMHKDGTRLLLIRFTTNADDALICTVEDNGVGRVAALEYRRRHDFRSDNHTGKGLTISSERLQILNQRTGRNHRLRIEDLYDADGNAAGTKVVVVFD